MPALLPLWPLQIQNEKQTKTIKKMYLSLLDNATDFLFHLKTASLLFVFDICLTCFFDLISDSVRMITAARGFMREIKKKKEKRCTAHTIGETQKQPQHPFGKLSLTI